MPHQSCVGSAAERGLDVTSSVGVCWCVHNQRRVGRAAERCLDPTNSVVCVGVDVWVLKCTTSAGLAGQPNGTWMLLAVWCVLVLVCVSQNEARAGCLRARV